VAPYLVGSLLILAVRARGQEMVPSTAVSASDTDNSTISFPKGLRLVTIYGGIAEQPTGEREQLAFCTAGLNYYFWDNWAFGIEFTGLGAAQTQEDVAAGGGDLLIRTHLWNYKQFSFYGDFAAGVLEASARIPPSGTDFNFDIQTGVGGAFHLYRNIDFLMGLRYFHLSNARQHGPERNPSLNAIEGYAGLMFRM
jgi:hypothetical protein